jgi:hypothetical protein
MNWIAGYLAFNAVVFVALRLRPISRRVFVGFRRMVRL